MSNQVMLPRESGSFIASHSKDVSLCEEGISRASEIVFKSLKSNAYSYKTWKDHELHPKEMSKATVDWIFVLDTLNFSFWVDDGLEPWTIRHKGKDFQGYWALCAGINRAIEEGIHLTSPSYYRNITIDDLKHIFRSETSTEMPLLEERAKNLRETGNILAQTFQNSFAHMILLANKSAKLLLSMVINNFDCFRDDGDFCNQKVSFYKRAQILIADTWACFEGKGFGEFPDIDFLTMFADYKVPQGLYDLGVLQFSEALKQKLVTGQLIPHGDQLEMEIRGNSIWAVEKIYLAVKLKAKKSPEFSNMDSLELAQYLNSVIIDFYLWDFSKNVEARASIPCHKTRTIFY
ncbi:predicted protein [Nematostella vectensis]|uniref:Queuosine 5'-phosphate N-glycosylase/hydrolase n=1 Tax=Nematostella vectensis TaxID=45351 RepID=QNG1_NEMVE|nr:queuosine salvage protein [Nematostella vectensis]A7SNN9.1 RecName: Full=Queuosine 5'-phosphate N-glycosylase/hydrolase; AltName: Full=Queuosine-nucleotide N-glycosylase/hydrolase [Nematostella vectensis]EDO34709.1 predicted protein [Nematostella vectensis]|eukprot:XP_001626809.1 predicted protein [Nematostella vectensis]